MPTTHSEMITSGETKDWRKAAELGLRLRERIFTLSRKIAERTRSEEAAELLEFALAVPLILVMLVGLLDFAHAYNIKQKLANATREGARLAASLGRNDLTNSNPPSVTTVKDDITTYLADAKIDTSFIGTTMSYDPSPLVCTATYYTTSGVNNYGLKIERCVQVPYTAGGTTIPSVRVTLNYPYNWTFGFNHVIQMLLPSANYTGTINIEADTTMSY